VKICRVTNRGRDLYQVVYFLGPERKRLSFGDPEEAQLEAEEKAALLARGQAHALTLTGADRDAYLAAREMLAPLGVPLGSAVEEYVRARKLLGDRPLISAVEQWIADHAPTNSVATVPQVVDECIKAKTADGLSESYMRPFSCRVRRFAKSVRG